MKLLTREQLDLAGCDNPECDNVDHRTLTLHSRCHPTQGTRATYVRGTGVLTIACNECRAPIVEIAVA